MAQPEDDIQTPATNANFSTGAAAGQPTKVQPSAGEIADGQLAGEPYLPQHHNFVANNHAQWLLDERDSRIGMFGDGSDGNVTIAAGTTTLTEDMHYASLTIEPGGVLATAGYKVFVAGLLAIEAGGQIRHNGGDGGDASGAVGAAGAAAAFGSLGVSGTGAPGVEDAVGVAGANADNALGGAGGAGGSTTGVVRAGGAGGLSNAPAAGDGSTRHVSAAMGVIFGTGNGTTVTSTLLRPGAGGGSGASVAAAGYSGGGGGGGGIISIHAHTILIDPDATPAIQANGGDGGDPDGAVEIGGSGGGGGGAILIAYRRLLDGVAVATATPREPADLAAAGITIEALGGTASAGINSGGDGADGSDGTILWWRV
jgi:hypothetical protein